MTEEEVKAKYARKASKAIVGGFSPSEDPLASWFGCVRVALPDETWPMSDGKPMMPLCQFNLTELPFRPDNLADIAFITIFTKGNNPPDPRAANGEGWLLRAYPTLEELIAIEEPEDRKWLRPLPIQWESIDADCPALDDLTELIFPIDADGTAEQHTEQYFDNFYDNFSLQPALDTKIGGWPFTVQSSIYWGPHGKHPANPEFVFQIDSEYKAGWAWGDSGLGYFGRGTGTARDQWVLDWQCY